MYHDHNRNGEDYFVDGLLCNIHLKKVPKSKKANGKQKQLEDNVNIPGIMLQNRT